MKTTNLLYAISLIGLIICSKASYSAEQCVVEATSAEEAVACVLVSLAALNAENNVLQARVVKLEAALKKSTGVEPDAVVMFDSSDCPQGWRRHDELAGRVVVAAGDGQGLSEKFLGEKGGSESVVLHADNLPPHTHGTTTRSNTTGVRGPSGDVPNVWIGARQVQSVTNESEHSSISIMQPFYVLTPCVKE